VSFPGAVVVIVDIVKLPFSDGVMGEYPMGEFDVFPFL
jgi:hypothetical protein